MRCCGPPPWAAERSHLEPGRWCARPDAADAALRTAERAIARGIEPASKSRVATSWCETAEPRAGAALPCPALSGCRAPLGRGEVARGDPMAGQRRPVERAGRRLAGPPVPRARRRGTRHRTRRRRRSCRPRTEAASRRRSGSASSPRRGRGPTRPAAPRLMTTTGAKASSPSSAHPPRSASASAAVANSRSGATDRSERLGGVCPAASSGPLEARSTLIAAPFIRASWVAHRPAEPSGSPSSE